MAKKRYDFDNLFEQASTLVEIGDVYVGKQQFNQALEKYNEASEIYFQIAKNEPAESERRAFMKSILESHISQTEAIKLMAQESTSSPHVSPRGGFN